MSHIGLLRSLSHLLVDSEKQIVRYAFACADPWIGSSGNGRSKFNYKARRSRENGDLRRNRNASILLPSPGLLKGAIGGASPGILVRSTEIGGKLLMLKLILPSVAKLAQTASS